MIRAIFLDLKNKKLDLKTNFLAFLDVKNNCSSLYIPEICLKSLFFGPLSPNVFVDLFFRYPQIF